MAIVNFVHRILDFKRLSPAQKIAISFMFVILSGAVLLMLPISNRNGEFFSPIDALFTATSATCVTGLSTITIAEQFNWFGHLVIVLLIQIGGLGLMTFMAVLLLILKNRLSVNEKIVMKEMLNQDKVFDMKKFLLDILRYTLFFEAIGAILISFRMIDVYGPVDGVLKAAFLSVSAFCNAGFDTLGPISMQGYVHDPLMMFTIMSLIVLGGVGFAVWFDVRDKLGMLVRKKINFKKFRHSLTLHTRIVILVTVFLILGAGLLIMLIEYDNPLTIGTFTLPDKMMSATFESVALRTAGFTSINYANLRTGTQLIMMITMFIGGSPGGTAGGIKTTTFAILVIYMISMLKGRENTVVMRRNIGKGVIIRAMGIFFINLFTLFTGIFFLCLLEDKPMNALCFEAVSAMATVGSSLGITAALTFGGKIVIILLMYIGRIGISTLIISLVKPRHSHDAKDKVNYPDGTIIVG